MKAALDSCIEEFDFIYAPTSKCGGFSMFQDELIKLNVRLRHGERGQTMAEYAVVLAVIAIGIFVALGVLSGSIRGALSSVSSKI